MNPQNTFADFVREGMTMLGEVGMPIFAALVGVGLIVGILQSATQIQDPAIGFLPRLVTGLGVALATGPWILRHFIEYLQSAFVHMGNVLR